MKRDIQSDFKKDVAKHTMRIHRDDGVYRHIEFSRNGSFDCRFFLVTWPGYLAIVGDCGDFTFERHEDMFRFFRMSDEAVKKHGGDILINPYYWQEKLRAGVSSGREISEEFSLGKFKAEVCDWFNSIYPKKDRDITRKERREIWEQVKSEILDVAEDEWSAVTAIRDFDDDIISFEDFWEVRISEYKGHYIWCLYAIVWGIQQYDNHKAAEAAAKQADLPIGIDSEGGSHD